MSLLVPALFRKVDFTANQTHFGEHVPSCHNLANIKGELLMNTGANVIKEVNIDRSGSGRSG